MINSLLQLFCLDFNFNHVLPVIGAIKFHGKCIYLMKHRVSETKIDIIEIDVVLVYLKNNVVRRTPPKKIDFFILILI